MTKNASLPNLDWNTVQAHVMAVTHTTKKTMKNAAEALKAWWPSLRADQWKPFSRRQLAETFGMKAENSVLTIVETLVVGDILEEKRNGKTAPRSYRVRKEFVEALKKVKPAKAGVVTSDDYSNPPQPPVSNSPLNGSAQVRRPEPQRRARTQRRIAMVADAAAQIVDPTEIRVPKNMGDAEQIMRRLHSRITERLGKASEALREIAEHTESPQQRERALLAMSEVFVAQGYACSMERVLLALAH